MSTFHSVKTNATQKFSLKTPKKKTENNSSNKLIKQPEKERFGKDFPKFVM